MQRLILPFFLMFVVAGCAAADPFKAAKTFEQTAYAAVRSYAIAQDKARDIIRDPSAPDSVKLLIQTVVGPTTPAVQVLRTALAELSELRAQYLAAPSPDLSQKAAAAFTVATRLYATTGPEIDKLVALIDRFGG